MRRTLFANVPLKGPWKRSGARTGQYEHRCQGTGNSAPTASRSPASTRSISLSEHVQRSAGHVGVGLTRGRDGADDVDEVVEDDRRVHQQVGIHAIGADDGGFCVAVLGVHSVLPTLQLVSDDRYRDYGETYLVSEPAESAVPFSMVAMVCGRSSLLRPGSTLIITAGGGERHGATHRSSELVNGRCG